MCHIPILFLDKKTFQENELSLDLPTIKIKSTDVNQGISLLDFLSKNKIMSSKSEARRAIANKGIKIDNIIVVNENKKLQQVDFKKKVLKISYGKKIHYLVKII